MDLSLSLCHHLQSLNLVLALDFPRSDQQLVVTLLAFLSNRFLSLFMVSFFLFDPFTTKLVVSWIFLPPHLYYITVTSSE